MITGLALSLALTGQIYKCVEGGQVKYADKPCAGSAEAKPLKLLGVGPIRKEEVLARDNVQENSLAVEATDIRYDHGLCLSAASTARRPYDLRATSLENQIAYAANNQAGATWENGLREQIQSERKRGDDAEQLAMGRCDKARERREKAHAKKVKDYEDSLNKSE